jgi:hypothetical protein
VLYTPVHSLIDQSLHSKLGAEITNGDGFGIGWYDTAAAPGVFRSTEPAWNDQNLHEVAGHVTSPLFFAHIRAAIGSSVQQTNCHPFRYDRWLWMHNGYLSGFARPGQLSRWLGWSAWRAGQLADGDAAGQCVFTAASGLCAAVFTSPSAVVRLPRALTLGFVVRLFTAASSLAVADFSALACAWYSPFVSFTKVVRLAWTSGRFVLISLTVPAPTLR